MSTGFSWVRIVATGVASSTVFGSVKEQDLNNYRCFSSGKVTSSSIRQIMVPCVCGSNTNSYTVSRQRRHLRGWWLTLKLSVRKERNITIRFIFTTIQRRMLSNKRRGYYSFIRKDRSIPKEVSLTIHPQLQDFSSLKKEVKRIEIMTRMERRQKSTSTAHPNKQRPTTSSTKSKTGYVSSDFKAVGKEYLREKKLVKTALEEQKKEEEVERGLLGEWKRYQTFSKHQLIEKLISLEHLANTIFKRNKHLQEELAKIKNN